MDAEFNLKMGTKCPNWYELLPDVARAMEVANAAWAVRKDYGWEGDDGGEWGPNPLQPGESIMEADWEDELALPFPEDFNAADAYVYELMEIAGKYKDDPALMVHMLAMRAADYLGNLGEPSIGVIRGQLRRSSIIPNNA